MTGIKLAKVGGTINDSDKNLAFTNERNILKAILEGIINVSYTASSGVANTSFAHGLSFTPQVLAFVSNLAGRYFGTGGDPDNTSDGNYISLNAWADATTVYLQVKISSLSTLYASNQTVPVKYFVIADTAREANTQSPFPLPHARLGLKIARPGKSASSPFIEDYIVHPQMPSLKLKKQGSTSITSGGTVAIPHGLPFIPAFLLMATNDATFFFLAPYNRSIGGDSAYGWTDTTNLNIRSFNFPAAVHYFRYLIFANKLNE